MSERSFGRRYAEATRVTPARAVKRLRVKVARRLVFDRLPVKRIAAPRLRKLQQLLWRREVFRCPGT
jgi:hypothetical protein